jgi:hypothetical protein
LDAGVEELDFEGSVCNWAFLPDELIQPGLLNFAEAVWDNEIQIEAPGATLVAQLLGLLVTFIGEHLMLTLVRDAWPDLPILDDGTLEKN